MSSVLLCLASSSQEGYAARPPFWYSLEILQSRVLLSPHLQAGCSYRRTRDELRRVLFASPHATESFPPHHPNCTPRTWALQMLCRSLYVSWAELMYDVCSVGVCSCIGMHVCQELCGWTGRSGGRELGACGVCTVRLRGGEAYVFPSIKK